MICPGHVASIMGSDTFRFITDDYGLPAVVCGFDYQDIVAGICLLLEQITYKRSIEFVNLYKRCVRLKGNVIARNMIDEVFSVVDGEWRGIGTVKNSALVLERKYDRFDAFKRFEIEKKPYRYSDSCHCSEIIIGLKMPYQCDLFGRICSPRNPLGPCMVSSEGACAAHYRYGGGKNYG